MRVISYSLFGYGKDKAENCFEFNCYLRGLMVNIRLQRLLFPDWRIRVHLDKQTYEGFKRFWELLSEDVHTNAIDIVICEDAPLTKAMLWRLKPMFDENVEVFICRDIEAPLMYKDVQAVTQWIDSTKVAHAITSSNSHNIPMMGGMIGFKRGARDRTGANTWEQMVNARLRWDVKGTDQDFLTNYIYELFALRPDDSIMQHYFYGMSDTFLDGYKTCSCPQLGTHADDCHLNVHVEIPFELKETDHLCGHIGAAGHYGTSMEKFLLDYIDMNEDLQMVESPYNPNSDYYNTELKKPIFNWNI